MVQTRPVSTRPGDVLLLVGTIKGAFLFRSERGARAMGARRTALSRATPSTPWPTTAAPGRRRIWAAPESVHWGARAARRATTSARRGRGPSEANVSFPEDTGTSLRADLADRPRPRRRAGHAVLRRRAGRALRVARRRRDLVAGAGPVRPSRTARAGSRAAAGSACTPSCPIPRDPRAHARRHLHRRASTAPRTAAHLAHRATSGVRAEFLPDKHPGVRPVRAQGGAASRAAGPAVPAEPLGPLPQRRRAATSWTDIANGVPSDFGFAMAIHPHDPDTRLHRAARVRRVPLHARGPAARLPHARTPASPGRR